MEEQNKDELSEKELEDKKDTSIEKAKNSEIDKKSNRQENSDQESNIEEIESVVISVVNALEKRTMLFQGPRPDPETLKGMKM